MQMEGEDLFRGQLFCCSVLKTKFIFANKNNGTKFTKSKLDKTGGNNVFSMDPPLASTLCPKYRSSYFTLRLFKLTNSQTFHKLYPFFSNKYSGAKSKLRVGAEIA